MTMILILFALAALCFTVGIMQTVSQKRAEAAQAAACEAERCRKERLAREKARQAEASRAALQAEKKRQAQARAAEKDRKKAEAAAAREARQEEQKRRTAEKLEEARKLAEYNERALAAARALKALESKEVDPAATVPEERPATIQQKEEAQAVPEERPITIPEAPAQEAPRPFAGQTVAFTGRLAISGLTHAQARERVKLAGGTAYDKEMPASTTILVVGDNPGMQKMDKADAWIGSVRKMTERQFLDMLASA